MTTDRTTISLRTKYALKALLMLAALPQGASPVPSALLRGNSISGEFMAKILGDLRRVGLVESRRGRLGGYSLSRPAAEITFAEVMQLMEDPLLNLNVGREPDDEQRESPEGPGNQVREVLERATLEAVAVLQSTTLAEALTYGSRLERPFARSLT